LAGHGGPAWRSDCSLAVLCSPALEVETMMLSEADARNLALRALDRLGGPQAVYRSPRHPFSPTGMRVFTLDDVEIRIRYGEISSPAVIELAGYVFEIREDELILLFRPPSP
jgi:hypothetical protein